MLQSPISSPAGADCSCPFESEQASPQPVHFDYFLAAARRQRSVFLAIFFTSLVAGAGFLFSVQPLYTADASILIDNRRVRAVESAYDVSEASSEIATSVLDSQVEVARAGKVSLKVIQTLGLLNDPEFAGSLSPKPGMFEEFRRELFGHSSAVRGGGESSLDEQARLQNAVQLLGKGLDVRRVARTMVLQISYTSANPGQAARLANAFAEAYLADQLDTKYEATRRATQWLEERIAELKTKVLKSDLAIQSFRAGHGLISSGGKLVNEQQLSEVSTQLVTVRGETAKAEARYRRIDAIIKGHETNAIITEAIGNLAIEQLRSKYLDASKRYSELAAKLGEDHQAAANLRTEKNEYEKLMFEELAHLAQGYASELEISKTREKSLEDDLKRIVGLNANENNDLVQLREMEQEEAAFRGLYQTYLQRYNETLQQQSFPIIEARIITSAATPSKPSYPKKLPVAVLFGLLGSIAGFGAGAFREFKEKGFYSGAQVRALGTGFLGILPKVQQMPPSSAVPATMASGGTAGTAQLQAASLPANGGILSYSVLRSGSAFTETLRAVKLAADERASGEFAKVIGIVSAMPGEGKTVFAKNFASLLASMGHKTLLIDGDLRSAGLTKQLAPGARQGLVDAALYGKPIQELLLQERSSGLRFLPCVLAPGRSNSPDLLSSAGMKSALPGVREAFDYIIVDLPAILPAMDARAFAPQAHAFVFLVEWRKTARYLVQEVLRSSPEVAGKCLGIVLNKADLDELRYFEGAAPHYSHYGE